MDKAEKDGGNEELWSFYIELLQYRIEWHQFADFRLPQSSSSGVANLLIPKIEFASC
jgi:hypothetical protein